MTNLSELIQSAKFNQIKDNDRIRDKTKPLSPATMKNYISNITKLHKVLNIQMEITNLLWLEQYKTEIIKYINDLDNPNTKKNYLSIIITLLSSPKFPVKNKSDYKNLVDEYLQLIKSNYDNIQLHQEKTKTIKKDDDDIITLKQLEDFIKELSNNKNFQKEYIIFSILRYFPIRNEVGTLIYIKNTDYNKLDKQEQKNNNWLIEKSKTIEMVRWKFKTAEHYINELPFINIIEQPLKSILKKYIKDNNINSNEPLFNFTENQVSHRLSYISCSRLGIKLSTTSVFKILCNNVVKNNDTKTATELLKIYGKIRGTNLNKNIQNYYKADSNKQDRNKQEDSLREESID